MKHKKLSARILSLILTVSMVSNMVPATAFAADGTALIGESSVECHAVHTADCGYKEAVVGTPATEETSCSKACEGEHVADCAYKAAVAELPAVEGAACTHTCEQCKVKDSGEENKKPALEQSAYDKVVGLFTALPNASELTKDNKDAFVAQLSAAMEAFNALDTNEQDLFLKKQLSLYTAAMALNDAITGAKPVTMGSPVTRNRALELGRSVTYLAKDGTEKTANPTTTSITDTNEGWSWDLTTKTLTLSGATIISDLKIGINMADGDSTIVLADGTVNKVTAKAQIGGGIYSLNGDGIYSSDPLTITGTGTLYTTGSVARSTSNGITYYGSSYGIRTASALTIKGNPTIYATGADITNTGSDSTGIKVEYVGSNAKNNILTISGGNIIAKGGNATAAANSYGIDAYKLAVSGGNLTATGGNTAGKYSYGIVYHDDINTQRDDKIFSGDAVVIATGGAATVESIGIVAASNSSYDDYFNISDTAKVTATGGDMTTTGRSVGVYADVVATYGKSEVIATGQTGAAESSGIRGNSILLSDESKVTAKGSKVDTNGKSYGLFSSGNINLKNSADVVATGGDVKSGGESSGIYSENSVLIEKTTKAIATGGVGDVSYGISALNDITINGGVGTASITGTASAGTAGAFNKQPTGTFGDEITMWDEKTATWPVFAITFDARNGTRRKVMIDEDTLKIPAIPADPSWTEYTFGGWYTGVDGTGTAFVNENLNAPKTVYAKWTRGNKTVVTSALRLEEMATVDNITTHGWKWDADTNTLTLDGMILHNNTLDSESFGIMSPNGTSITIIIVDGSENNIVSGDNPEAYLSIGIGAEADVIIKTSGSGTPGKLTLAGGQASDMSAGIMCFGNITIESGDITASAGQVDLDPSCTSFGIFAMEGIAITGGKGKATTDMQATPVSAGAFNMQPTGNIGSGITAWADQSSSWPESISVSFDACNGTAPNKVDISTIGMVTMPATPIWSGTDYTFAGWYTGVDGTGKSFVNSGLTASTKVYAKWTKSGKMVYTKRLDLLNATTNLSGDGYAWDNATQTLTLSGVTIDCTNDKTAPEYISDADTVYGVLISANATIKLVAGTESTIISAKVANNGSMPDLASYGVFAYDETSYARLKIEGEGTLNAIGGSVTGSLTSSTGFYINGNIDITGGVINSTGGTTTSTIDRDGNIPYSLSTGIDAVKGLTINGGAMLNATGGNATSIDDADGDGEADSTGVSALRIYVKGGIINAVAGVASHPTVKYSTGIVTSIMEITDGMVTAMGMEKAVSADPITADGASVTGANENFESGVTEVLTQADLAIPVVISFLPCIAVSPQTGTATYSTATSPTFTVTNNNFGGKYPAFAPNIIWTSGRAPTGVTAAISSDKASITMNTTSATPAGEYKFKVVSAEKLPATGNYESAEATLMVDKLTATITWSETTSFTYNGKMQAPTANVTNKVGSDVVTVTVTGGQTKVGSHTATADALAGAAADNYKLADIKPTKTFTITKVAYTGTQAAAPIAPKATKTHNSVTLALIAVADENVEYGISDSAAGTITWQEGSGFTGLDPNKTYFFFARVKDNDTHTAGTTSAGTAIKTKAVPTTISGVVKDSTDTVVVSATVELKQGSTQVMPAVTTDTSGNYTLNNVPEGVYNLVITRTTGTAPNTVTTVITETITVAGTPLTGKNIKFLAGDKNTVVESKPGTPEVVVGGMNALLDDTNISNTLTASEKTTVEAGGSVELKFAADVKSGSQVSSDKSAIEAIATGKKIDMLLDLSVLKTIKDGNGVTTTDGIKITSLAGIIEVHIPIPADLQGKDGLSLYRVHNGVAQQLQKGSVNAVDGEYYDISADETYTTLYIKNFSTYALGANAYTVTLADVGVGANGGGNYYDGDKVTITAGSKSNYSFTGWTVTAGTATLANVSSASTTFTMPIGNVTITANWTYNGGSSGGSGSSSETYFYIKATAGIGGSMSTPEKVQVKIGESAGFTITPNKGYQIADVIVNGKSIGAKNYYAFTNILSDQTIHATFKLAGHKNPQTGVNVDDVNEND